MKNEKIRVAHIIGKWLGGGVEAVVMNYYRNMKRENISFDFICDDDSTNIPYDEIKSLGGRVIIVPSYTNVIKYDKELTKIFKKNNYKIVHSHINTLSVFPLRIAKKCNIPIRIAHSHSTTNKIEWKKNIIKNILKPFSKLYATDYYACSKYAGEWLFGSKCCDFKILNNAINIDNFAYSEKYRKEIRKELKIKDDTLVIGHIGRFVAQKNHTFLIDIFNALLKKNPNSMLLLVGQGQLQDDIKLKVKNLGIEDKVLFLNQRNDAYKLYQAFDVFLLPSLYEGLAVVGVEAQASGLLCVLSDSMTKETKVLGSTTFVSLSKAPSYWANVILNKHKNFVRKNTKDELIKANFDITKEADNLEKDYLNLIKKSKKKIFFIVSSNIYSGAEAVNLNIIKNLSNEYDFSWVSPSGMINKYLDEYCVNHIEINNLSVQEIKRVIKENSPDILHATDYRASVLCGLSCGRVPYISHLHNNALWLKKICPFSFAYLFAGLRAKSILIVSDSIEKEYVFSKFIRKKICNISNPISRKNIIDSVNKKDKKIYDVCFVGRLTESKNPLRIIDIISKLKEKNKNIKAVFVGDGELKGQCEEKIKQLKLENNVNLVGFQRNPYSYMNKSKVFLFPSIYEGFGLVLFEALTLGLPCYATKVGGIADIVTNKCGHFCDTDEEFIKNILDVLNNEEKYNKLSMEAIKRSHVLDNSEEYYKNIEKIYNNL